MAPAFRTSPRLCERGTCVAGAGIDIDIFRPWHDLYETNEAIVEIAMDIPEWLNGLAYATFDRFAVSGIRTSQSTPGDVRTNERISVAQLDKVLQLTRAMMRRAGS